MGLILEWLVALGPVILPLVRRVLIGLGIGVATYTGVNALWTATQANIWASIGGTAASILQLLAIAKVDQGIQIILSAGTARLVLRGLNAATGALSGWRVGA